MNQLDLATATWLKSTHSGSNEGNCVEVTSLVVA
ncbi:DUF397 domain-containing protein [Actinoallomurus sp. NPDC052274]